jgi:hypothetical protein
MAHMIPIGLAVAGAAMSAGGTILGAKAEASSLRSEADQLDTQAGQFRASSQRQAMEERRQAGLAGSRALAIGAAQGGASDPTVMNLLAALEGEGSYRAAAALFEGEERARSNEVEANARRKEAKNVKRAGLISAASTILSSGSSLAQKYG